jgi:hypothetical protein
LATLPVADQRAIIAMHKADASNLEVPESDREYAAKRAKILTRLMGLNATKKRKRK